MKRRLSALGILASVSLAHASAFAQAPAPAAAAPPAAAVKADTPTSAVAKAEPAPAPAVQAEAAPSAAVAATAAPTAKSDEALPLPETGADDSFVASDPNASGILAGEESPKLELYGFADVSYFHVLSKQTTILRQYVSPYPSFFVGHFNLYLSSQLSSNWRALAEVRFLYSPLGDEDKQGANGTFPATDSVANDYAELQRSFSWGGIEVQRVWIEYQPFDFFTIRAGQWFTPYGYWNDDHGSPAIIPVHKPFPIADFYFPEKQTGLEVYGKYFIDSTAIGYALTLSNGRGPYDAIRDLDNNKAVGGRLYLETSALGNLNFGVSAYRGRYTASTKKYSVNTSGSTPVAEIYRQVDSAYEELSLCADVRWLYKDVTVQAEFMTNEAAYDENARPRTIGFDPRPTFTADYRRIGGYLLLGYRLPWLNLMPFGMVEHSSYTNSDFVPPATAWTGGINMRPTANVVLKAEYATAFFNGIGSTGAGKGGLSYVSTQVAWAY
jgi:hypothetical protein